MLYWLAQTCREARLAAGRKQVHIGASADVDQSTVNRFENAVAWPRNADRLVEAYAADLELEPIDLWQAALSRWLDHISEIGDEYVRSQAGGEAPTVEEADDALHLGDLDSNDQDEPEEGSDGPS